MIVKPIYSLLHSEYKNSFTESRDLITLIYNVTQISNNKTYYPYNRSFVTWESNMVHGYLYNLLFLKLN